MHERMFVSCMLSGVLFRVNFISHLSTLQVVNVLHAQTNNDLWSPGGSDTPQAVVNEIASALAASYRAILPTTYTFDRIDCVEVPNPNDPTQVPRAATSLQNVAGTRVVSNSDLPAPVCAVLKLKTGSVGRSFRGHLFMPPCESSSQIANDVFTGAGTYIPPIDAFAAKLNDSFSGGASWATLWLTTWDAKLVVYSPTRHRQGVNPVTSEIVAASTDRTVHWLRSRRT